MLGLQVGRRPREVIRRLRPLPARHPVGSRSRTTPVCCRRSARLCSRESTSSGGRSKFGRSPGPSPRARRLLRAPPARTVPHSAERLQRLVSFDCESDRIADRPLQECGPELPLDQVIGRPGLHRLDIHFPVAVAGEHDDRRTAAFGQSPRGANRGLSALPRL